MRSVFLDYNATTPLDPRVREAMLPFWAEIWGNPSSIHHLGRGARALLDDFREELATGLRCKPSELIFTSGATEANNLAILGLARANRSRGRHLVVSGIEHPSVLRTATYLADREGFELSVVPVDRFGLVDPGEVVALLRPDTVLVSVMSANNEVGSIQPVAQIGEVCRGRGIPFHTDAVQWFGKLACPGIGEFNADAVSISAHKFHGPKGSGALFFRSGLRLDPMLFGGGQENDRRAGTENLASIAGLVAAFRLFVPRPVFDPDWLQPLKDRLARGLEALPGVVLWSDVARGLANTLALSVDNCDSLTLLAGLDLAGVCASSGSACSSGSLEPSHVLLAMGARPDQAASMIRFSLGRGTTADDLEAALDALASVINRVHNLP
ncbi:MAG: cysteine desulfurase family protein [Limisphaerales bacterium]